MTVVRLGYEVGSRSPVEIPIHHLVVTGITQMAGKTTALEGLIHRSGLRAITFVTKRGEQSFAGARRIDPYFRERADWQFVAAILEAHRGERMKFERSWIMKASKGARTLADVLRNTRELGRKSKRGMDADLYMQLEAYLDEIVPQIARIKWAPAITLEDGVNAMDLTHISVELQHLVIRSALDWVLEREERTVVVIPEAWKFVPEGRNTPVKLAAESFIRQGAALGNYVWLDSQDIAGVEKKILKQCPVWVLGVQRESNEIKRTLDNIPNGIKKPKGADIATMSLGQFYACWGTHAVKTYVQPAWMADEDAEQIAEGKSSVTTVANLRSIRENIKRQPSTSPSIEEPTVKESEARQLREENQRLEKSNAELLERIERLENREHRPIPAVADVPETTVTSGAWKPGDTEDDLYRRFKARLIGELPSDPVVMRIVVSQPELRVEVERKTVTIDGTSVKGRVARLLADGFFRAPQGQGDTRSELRKSGPDINTGTLSKVFGELLSDGFLRKHGMTKYLEVEGMKVNIVER